MMPAADNKSGAALGLKECVCLHRERFPGFWDSAGLRGTFRDAPDSI
jgi:hypothetical protein